MPFEGLKLQVLSDSSVPPIVLMVLYFVGTMITIANYVAYVRYNEAVYGADLVRAYLAFTIVGVSMYALLSAVCWLWAAKYVTTSSERLQKLAMGMLAIFVFHDLPIFSMEWHMILCCGWRNPFQGFCFVKQIMLFILSFSFGWLMYAYIAAGWLNAAYGDPSELKTGGEMIVILPAATVDRIGYASPAAFTDRSLASPLLPQSQKVLASNYDDRGTAVRWSNAASEQQPVPNGTMAMPGMGGGNLLSNGSGAAMVAQTTSDRTAGSYAHLPLQQQYSMSSHDPLMMDHAADASWQPPPHHRHQPPPNGTGGGRLSRQGSGMQWSDDGSGDFAGPQQADAFIRGGRPDPFQYAAGGMHNDGHYRDENSMFAQRRGSEDRRALLGGAPHGGWGGHEGFDQAPGGGGPRLCGRGPGASMYVERQTL